MARARMPVYTNNDFATIPGATLLLLSPGIGVQQRCLVAPVRTIYYVVAGPRARIILSVGCGVSGLRMILDNGTTNHFDR